MEEGKGEGKVNLALTFQVAEVKKPLISVKRITEKGNQVCFGPRKEDSFILNVETGDKVFLRKNGRGSYLLDVTFASGRKAEITVDSGAEESVCPWGWGEEYGLSQGGQKMFFSGDKWGLDHALW